ncbi:lipocalin family protein [Christiangramia crocea]|uniref:Lipocalin family protein n=1 Tax=Christiangramia crocea TaxID=2904124 RepID=A0A9X1UZS4_9FLAO|nr:lipocalin family protein [Gramella crocea]MCG9973313.1 lipocalin family protein [Gramella crocea]
MKKILILFLSLSLFASCSDDDGTNTDDGSKIVGKWFLLDVRSSGQQNTLSECNQQSFIEFMADGSATSEFYEETDGNCELDDSDDGNWTYLGDSRYTFFIPNVGTQTGTVSFTSNSQFIFTTPSLPGVEVVFEK